MQNAPIHQQYNPSMPVQMTFFGQVMAFFALALAASAVGVYVGFEYAMQYFVQSRWLIYSIFALELILVLTANIWKRNPPGSYVIFALFTFLTGLTLAPLLAITIQLNGGEIIYKALAATTLTFVAMGLFAWKTSWNLAGMRGFLMAALLGMIVVSLIGIFVPWGNTFEMVFSGLGVILFSGYAMYDFQRIKNQQYAHPIDAALNLYLDIFNLFIYILRLLNATRRN
jgi:FtsH-binding integral membrane protein